MGIEFDQKVAKFYESVRVDYWSGARTKEFVEKLVEIESNVASKSLTSVFKSQQNQLDDIFFNQLTVPGLINASPLPNQQSAEIEEIPPYLKEETEISLATLSQHTSKNESMHVASQDSIISQQQSKKESLEPIREKKQPEQTKFNAYKPDEFIDMALSLTNQDLIVNRAKVMAKFKGKKGQFDTLPQWIQNFENEIRIEIENVRDFLKASTVELR